MRVDYDVYIKSAEWRQRANEAKRRAGYRCRVCNRSSREITLEAHHRTYDRLGHEDPDDITVLCRDCHELFEMNKKAGRPRRQPYQPTTYQPNTPSKELVLPTKSSPDPNKPWKGIAIVGAGIWVIIILAWSAAALFPLVPNSTLLTPVVTRVISTKAEPAISTVNQTSVVCGTPCSCSPVARTITRGAPVTVLETTNCGGDTWYKIGDREWLGPGLIDDGALNTTGLSSDHAMTIPPTPVASGPSPADCAKETNEEWANLCWEAIEDDYRSSQREEEYNYGFDEPAYDEPYYYDPFEDGRFVDEP